MTDRKLCIAVDSLIDHPRDTDLVADFLRREDAARYIGSLKFTAEMMMDFHNIDPFVQLTSDSRPNSYSVVADLSLSGGYKAMLKTVEFVRKRVNRSDMTFTFSQLNSLQGIQNVVDAERSRHEDTRFFLTGVLPENDLSCFKNDFYGLSPREFTIDKVERAKAIEGVYGVYGSAEFAHFRQSVEYLGAGITLYGGDYGIDIDEKRSTAFTQAYKTCSAVVLGKCLRMSGDIHKGYDQFVQMLESGQV